MVRRLPLAAWALCPARSPKVPQAAQDINHIRCGPSHRPTVNVYTADPSTNIVDFRGFDSSIILIQRGGIPRPIGNFPESLSQAILVGIMLVGRLGGRARDEARHTVDHQVVAGRERQPRYLELRALQTSSLHPRSHWSQYYEGGGYC